MAFLWQVVGREDKLLCWLCGPVNSAQNHTAVSAVTHSLNIVFSSDFREHAAPDHMAKRAAHRKCYASLSALHN